MNGQTSMNPNTCIAASMPDSAPPLAGAALADAINRQPYPKVTASHIESRIKKVDYLVLPDSTVTICNITLDNGYSVRGESACVDPRNFNLEIGKGLAYKDAFAKLWPLEGYLLAERRFLAEIELAPTLREQQYIAQSKQAAPGC